MQPDWPDETELLDFFSVEPVPLQKYSDHPRLDPLSYTVARDGLALKVVLDWAESIVSLELSRNEAPIFFGGFAEVVENVAIERSRSDARLKITCANGVQAYVQVDPDIRIWVHARQSFLDT